MIDIDTHREVFSWVLGLLAERGLLTLCEAGEEIAEQIRREAELRPLDKPKVHLQGIEELVTDKGYQGQKVFQSLAERMDQHADLQVRMFLDVPRTHGDTSSVSAQIARFVHTFKTTQWPNGARLPSVYCCEQIMENQTGKPGSLHAKCIVIDNDQAFVSSANFTEAAQNRNIEVGLLVRSGVLSERLSRFFDALVDSHYFVRAI